MNGSALIYAVTWLIRDTFRQAIASRICWIMLGVTAVCVFFCLGVSVEGGLGEPEPHSREIWTQDNKPYVGGAESLTKVRLLFGAFSGGEFRFPENAVHFIEVMLGTLVAGSLGLLMALVWTAGFMPEFLHPSAASVLFAKPLPRWTLLLGKYLGVVLFISFQIVVFFFATWIALGVKTGIWPHSYLAGIPLMILHFTVMYSFSMLVAVMTRSTMACIFATILFWLICWGANYGRHALVSLPALTDGKTQASTVSSLLAEATYWGLPKPADIVLVQQQAFAAGDHFATLARMPEFSAMLDAGKFYPLESMLASLLFAGLMLMLAARQLKQTDY